MKTMFVLLAVVGCTQKYASYDLIRKVDFNRESYERPVTAIDVLPQGTDQLKECFNQWLFFSNADKEKEREVPSMVRLLCPNRDYLVNATFTDTWWTTLIFTRACVDIETTCADPKRKK